MIVAPRRGCARPVAPWSDDLAGAGFDPAALAPEIVRFYELTTDWRLDVWSQWSPVALPAGWILSSLFARRLQQLALPLRPLDVAQGMDSRVVAVRNSAGHQVGAAWLRTLRSTGQVVYSGWYGPAQLRGDAAPSIRVVFPLPNGSLAVFLAERFRVYVDREGTLRTDHERDLRSIPIVRLHYRLEPKSH